MLEAVSPLTQIIQNNLAEIPSSSPCIIPNKNALRQIIRRAMKKKIPVEPKTLQEIDIPEELKVNAQRIFVKYFIVLFMVFVKHNFN